MKRQPVIYTSLCDFSDGVRFAVVPFNDIDGVRNECRIAMMHFDESVIQSAYGKGLSRTSGGRIFARGIPQAIDWLLSDPALKPKRKRRARGFVTLETALTTTGAMLIACGVAAALLLPFTFGWSVRDTRAVDDLAACQAGTDEVFATLEVSRQTTDSVVATLGTCMQVKNLMRGALEEMLAANASNFAVASACIEREQARAEACVCWDVETVEVR